MIEITPPLLITISTSEFCTRRDFWFNHGCCEFVVMLDVRKLRNWFNDAIRSCVVVCLYPDGHRGSRLPYVRT